MPHSELLLGALVRVVWCRNPTSLHAQGHVVYEKKRASPGTKYVVLHTSRGLKKISSALLRVKLSGAEGHVSYVHTDYLKSHSGSKRTISVV